MGSAKIVDLELKIRSRFYSQDAANCADYLLMNAQQLRDRARSLRMQRNRPERIVLPDRIRTRKYPIWSVKSVTIVSLILVLIVSAVTFSIGRRSILLEAEWVAAIVAGFLFVFLAAGLYRGVRVKKSEKAPTNFEMIDVGTAEGLDAGDWAGAIDGDWLAIILAPILFVVVGIALVLLIPLIVNLLWMLIFVFVVMLFWVFRFALRQVFARSRRTRGNLAMSLYFAGAYTMLYSGWLLVVLAGARYLVGPHG